MKLTLSFVVATLLAVSTGQPSRGQVSYPPADAGAAAAQASAASAKADQALTTANAAQATANGAVRLVGGSAPDTNGNVALPNAFTNATCMTCTMSGIALTGGATLNGVGLATSDDISGEVAARNAAISSFGATIPASVNGQIGAVIVPVYTDAMAVAANTTAITTVSNLAKAAGADVIQIVSPPSGGSVVTAAGTNVLFINNAGLLASLSVSFPASPADGQRFTVAANNIVTTMSFTGATSRGALTTFSANGYARFVYSTSLAIWFRVG